MRTTNYTGEPFGSEGLRIPDSKSIEAQVLADLTENNGLLSIARERINASMFSVEEYRKVWQILNEMSNRGETIDYSTLQPRTDIKTLSAIMRCIPAQENGTLEHCAALVEIATRR